MTLYHLLLAVQYASIALMLFMCAYITKRWSKPLHGWLFFYCMVTLINNAGYLALMCARTEEAALLAIQICYLGRAWIPFAFFQFVLLLCNRMRRIWLLNLLALFHAATYALVLFVRHNRLYYAAFWFTEGGLFPHIAHTNGVWHYAYNAVILLYIVIALTFLLQRLGAQKNPRKRRQLTAVIAAILADSVFFVLQLCNVIPGYDLTVIGYTLATLFLYVAVFHYDLLDTRELARDFMIDEVSEGIVAVNEDDSLSFYNKSAARIFPNIESDSAAVLAEIRSLRKNGDVLYEDSDGTVLQKGDRVYTMTEDKIVTDKKAARSAAVGTAYMLIDETERFKYIVDLREQKAIADKANKAKSEFLSNMSHEIRSPINAVLGLDEIILRESGEEQIRSYAADIQSSGRMLLSVINDILDFSKIESGKMDIIPVDYDVSFLIADLVNMTASKADAKGLRFSLEVDKTMPHCLTGDDTRVKQCVLNILTNAVKYTPSGSVTLTVSAEKAGDDAVMLAFSVQDTGIGIKSEDIKKLFSPFERIEEGRNRAIEGTGLGMSIVKSLLAAMGTKLDVESEYGKGSRFSFRVRQAVRSWEPIGDYEATKTAARKNAAAYTESFQAPDARILVVDDTPVNLTVMRGLLKQTRIQIDTAADGVEGLQKAKERKYDVIFIDHRMPKMDGMAMIASLRADEKSANCQSVCVALTANVGDDIRSEYTAAGFEDYLSKPVEPKLLEGLLSQYLPSAKVLHKGDAGYVDSATDRFAKQSAGAAASSSTADDFFAARFGVNLQSALKNCGDADVFAEALQGFYDAIDEKAAAIEQFAAAKDWQNYTVLVHALKSSARLIGAEHLSDAARELEAAGDTLKIQAGKADGGTAAESASNVWNTQAERISGEVTAKNANDAMKTQANKADVGTAAERTGDALNAHAANASDSTAQERDIAAKTAALLADYRAYKAKLAPLCASAPSAAGAQASMLPALSEAELSDLLSALREFATAFDFDSADAVIAELASHSLPAAFLPQYEKLKAAVLAADSAALLAAL